MRSILPLFACLALITCKTAPTTRQTAEAITDAAATQSKIDRASELAEDLKKAKTPEAKAAATQKYFAASQTALDAAQHTIDNLRQSLIQSETARGEGETKLGNCQANAEKFVWLKWLLIIGGPLSLAGAFLLGRKL